MPRKSQAELAMLPWSSRRTELELPRPTPQPPPHLGTEECELWRKIHSEYHIKTDTADAVLAVVLEDHMRARLARLQIEAEGMTIVGRDGQAIQHPCIKIEHQARVNFMRGIRQLGLQL
jgi:phage terminase small subunit